MLSAHLDPDSEGASRTAAPIDKTVDWVARHCGGGAHILDLGCGPGLYASRLANRGFRVTGVDINPVSVQYAQQHALERGLPIDYRCADYLAAPLGGSYDAAICIYCDFGALLPAEQEVFLGRVYQYLVAGGRLLFDVFGPGLSQGKEPSRDWTYVAGRDFWAAGPHWLLEECRHFPGRRAWGARTILLEEGCGPKEFITWDHYFTEGEIEGLLAARGFELESVHRGMVEKNDFASDDVLFVAARKR